MQKDNSENNTNNLSFEEKLKQCEDSIQNAKENYGDTEVREAIMVKAELYHKNDKIEEAKKVYIEAFEKTVGISKRLEIYMILLQIFFKENDLVAIKKYITKSKLLLEEGGDWERRNKLKVS